MSLLDERHPRLGRLMQLWRAQQRGEALPPASAVVGPALEDLAPATVLVTRLTNGSDELVIASSGSEVDALYGESLAGAPVRRLGSARGDAADEAMSAIESARPVVIEDELHLDRGRRRVARLYLPLSNDDGTPDGVLCGVIAVG